MTDEPQGKTRRPSRAEMLRKSYDEDRAKHPHRFIDDPDGAGPDFLFVENVAAMLACSVDFVRRIPRSELPASHRGQRLIYGRADVEAYIQAGRDTGTARYVADRKSGFRATVALSGEAAPFDAAAYARSLTKGKK